MLVLRRQSDDPSIHGHPRWVGLLERGIYAAERVSSLQGLLSPIALSFPFRGCYRRADVVHWHLVYPNIVSLPLVPLLTRMRPTVWTLHDPWATTGHCIHPLACERWRTGCGRCPDLKRNFAIWFDTTAFSWRIKRTLYKRSPLTLVVPSRWLKSRVEASPVLAGRPCHVIPPGLDLERWTLRERDACRARLGIPTTDHVLAFRLPHGRWSTGKGVPWLLRALDLYRPSRATTLIAFEDAGALRAMGDKYSIKDMGWLSDEEKLAEVLSAADVFLMPSEAETAPTMALEAMACGTAVIGSNNTGFPEIVRPPHAGLLVPPGDAEALAQAIEQLLSNDDLRRGMGEAGRRFVETEHPLSLHVQRHMELYRNVVAERGVRRG